MENTQTTYGYVVLSSGGTAVASSNVIVAKGTRVRVSGIMIAGAATTDIITVTDARGRLVCYGAAATSGIASFCPCTPAELDGLAVGAAGATTGQCVVFLAQ